MTEDATPAARLASTAFLQIWAESLGQVLGQISGSPLPCLVFPDAPGELAPADQSDLWILCACSGGLRGEMSLRLPAASALRLAQIFMSEPAAPEAEILPEHREAAVELLRQVGGVVASTLKTNWGEVQLLLDVSPGAPSWPSSSIHWVRAGEREALLEVHLSAALAAALRVEKADGSVAIGVSTPTPLAPEQSQVKLDLLMDVELAVTLRFGSRRLLLREVLELNPGAVVDLDRQVSEPIDVLLDGRLVARGEVVVLNGNYGLRVTEVAPNSV